MKKIIIDIEGGSIVGFSGLPKGYIVEVHDFDLKKVGEKWKMILRCP